MESSVSALEPIYIFSSILIYIVTVPWVKWQDKVVWMGQIVPKFFSWFQAFTIMWLWDCVWVHTWLQPELQSHLMEFINDACPTFLLEKNFKPLWHSHLSWKISRTEGTPAGCSHGDPQRVRHNRLLKHTCQYSYLYNIVCNILTIQNFSMDVMWTNLLRP